MEEGGSPAVALGEDHFVEEFDGWIVRALGLSFMDELIETYCKLATICRSEKRETDLAFVAAFACIEHCHAACSSGTHPS